MIRVLVAEDSPTARDLLVRILESDPAIRVVGQAADGVEAVALARTLRPDLITMDLAMPRMDGRAATIEIMITAPTPIVIVTAGTRRGEVAGSLEMLALGALDVLRKPPDPGSPGFAREARHLVATVKAMAGVKVVRRWRLAPARRIAPAAAPGRARAVALAASTGGPPALRRILEGLPCHFAAPVLVVQHIPPGFAEGLAAWLDGLGPLRVKLAEEGEPLRPGTVLVAPDHRHLGVGPDGRATLADAPPVDGFRPSATHLFDSVARAYGEAAVGVILTGMGVDGVRGLRTLHRLGGLVFAQDEPSSVVFGMPGAAIEAGVVDVVLGLDEIAARLAALT